MRPLRRNPRPRASPRAGLAGDGRGRSVSDSDQRTRPLRRELTSFTGAADYERIGRGILKTMPEIGRRCAIQQEKAEMTGLPAAACGATPESGIRAAAPGSGPGPLDHAKRDGPRRTPAATEAARHTGTWEESTPCGDRYLLRP